MTLEQLKKALDVCSEYDECVRCPAHDYCGDLSVVTGVALNAIETYEKAADDPTQELARCQNCGKHTLFTDAGGRCESYFGWLCNDCISLLKDQGKELHFEDEDCV